MLQLSQHWRHARHNYIEHIKDKQAQSDIDSDKQDSDFCESDTTDDTPSTCPRIQTPQLAAAVNEVLTKIITIDTISTEVESRQVVSKGFVDERNNPMNPSPSSDCLFASKRLMTTIRCTPMKVLAVPIPERYYDRVHEAKQTAAELSNCQVPFPQTLITGNQPTRIAWLEKTSQC